MRPVAPPNDVPKVHLLVFQAFESTHDALTFALARAPATRAAIGRGSPRSVLPQRVESLRSEFRVADVCVMFFMAQILLDRSRVVPIVCELVSACVAQHMRVNGKRQSRKLARTTHDKPHVPIRRRPAAFSDEDIRRRCVFALKTPKSSDLWTPQWVHARAAVLQPVHVQRAGFQIDLIPAQRYELRHTQAMAIREQDQSCIAVAMPPDATRCVRKSFNFVGNEVLAAANAGVCTTPVGLRRWSIETGR